MQRSDRQNIFIILVGILIGGFLGIIIIHIGSLLDDVQLMEGLFFNNLLARIASSPGRLFESSLLLAGFIFLGVVSIQILIIGRSLSQALNQVKTAREANKAKDDFISMLLHFIRTPLTGIRWSLKAMAEKATSQEQKTQLEKLYEENIKALTAVNHLLDVSRASLGRISYNFEVVNMNVLLKLINDTIDSMRDEST